MRTYPDTSAHGPLQAIGDTVVGGGGGSTIECFRLVFSLYAVVWTTVVHTSVVGTHVFSGAL